jgi:ubiquitin C-terminal hydrolase
MEVETTVSPATQKKHVADLLASLHYESKVGDEYYLVSWPWWVKWKLYVEFDDNEEKPKEPPGPPGRMDNSDLLEADGTLKPALMENIHYYVVPAEIWKLLVEWYGGEPEIKRLMIETGVNKTLIVEIYPLNITFVRKGMQAGNTWTTTVSRAEKIRRFKTTKLGFKFNMAPHQMAMRLVLDGGEYKTLDSTSMQTFEEAGVLDGSELQVAPDALAFEDNVDTMRPLVSAHPPAGQSAGNDNEELDDAEKNGSDTDSDNEYAPARGPKSRKTAHESSSSMFGSMKTMTRMRAAAEEEEVLNFSGEVGPSNGTTGLQNLGNTCFMNSALQCLSASEPLTRYFLEGKFQKDVNSDNPLGTGGQMAKAYAKLLLKMWRGNSSSVSPSEFKWVVGRFAPQFSGYNQHDSQELLAFLLDGLHEDLNRVTKKPYVESKSSDGRPDQEVATEAWEGHLKRNQSVIVDHFQGQLKSTLICPECNNISITFDPFMYLSLPLPVLTTRIIRISVVSLKDQVRVFNVKVEKKAKIGELKEKVGQIAGIVADRLLLADIYHGRIFQLLNDEASVTSIRENDVTFAYELMQEEDPGIKKVQHLQMVQRVHEKRSTFDSFDTFGFPVLLSVPLETEATAGQEFTNEKLYELVFETVKPYLTEQGKATAEKEPIFTLSLSSSTQSSGNLIKPDTSPVNLNGDNMLCVNWKTSDHYDTKRKFDEKGDKEQHQKDISLKDCLELFCQTEQLGKTDEWFCPKCKKFQQASKKFDLWTLPEILVIHLKRFQYTKYWRDKIDSYVDYPIHDLDLETYVLSDEYKKLHSTGYDLFAVSIHGGGLGGGHYTAYGKQFVSGKWYSFNDSSVHPVNEEQVKTGGAYLLFYKRRRSEKHGDLDAEMTPVEDLPIKSEDNNNNNNNNAGTPTPMNISADHLPSNL